METEKVRQVERIGRERRRGTRVFIYTNQVKLRESSPLTDFFHEYKISRLCVRVFETKCNPDGGTLVITGD